MWTYAAVEGAFICLHKPASKFGGNKELISFVFARHYMFYSKSMPPVQLLTSPILCQNRSDKMIVEKVTGKKKTMHIGLKS